MLYTQSHQPSGNIGDVWVDTGTGTFKAMSGGGWVTLFNFNQTNGGLMTLGGGIMNGPILGAHGLLGTNNPRMTGLPTLNNDDLVTINVMRDYIKAQIDLAIGTTTTTTPPPPTPTIKRQTVAFGMGTLPAAASYSDYLYIGPASNRTLWPSFMEEDGSYTMATVGQCKWIITPSSMVVMLYQSGNLNFKLEVDSTSNLRARAYTIRDTGAHENAPAGISWLVVAQRV